MAQQEVYKDYLVIGAGPAGTQLGYYFQRNNEDYLILERNDTAGSFFRRYPVRNELISFNKVHSIFSDPEIQLRWDWNSLLTEEYDFMFKQYSKKLYPKARTLAKYIDDYAKHFSLNIKFNTSITHVARNEKGEFLVTDNQGQHYRARTLIVATGQGTPHIPETIKGIELVEESYEAYIAEEYEKYDGKRVLIVGKGNSAFEIADQLIENTSILHMVSPKSITVAWDTRFAGNVRANHSRVLDTYQLKLLTGILDAQVEEIRKNEKGEFIVTIAYSHAEGEIDELIYDHVIRCAGFGFDYSIFDEETCKLNTWEIEARFPDISSGYESTNVKNLFFAGTLMQTRDFRRAASAFVDGFRYNCRTLFHILQERYNNTDLPHATIGFDAQEVKDFVTDRICITSALWAQFGYMADLLVIDKDKQEVRYYPELPADYVHDCAFGQLDDYYVITFEWGPKQEDAFSLKRKPTAEGASSNAFLHPIIRHYSKGEHQDEFHILEDLYGMYSEKGAHDNVHARYTRGDDNKKKLREWHQEHHDIPLLKYFARQMGEKIEMA